MVQRGDLRLSEGGCEWLEHRKGVFGVVLMAVEVAVDSGYRDRANEAKASESGRGGGREGGFWQSRRRYGGEGVL